MYHKLFTWILLAMFCLSGCGLASPAPTATLLPATPTATPLSTFIPSLSPTPTATLTPTPLPSPTLTPIPLGGGAGVIAFHSDRKGQAAVFVTGSGGQAPIQLTDGKSAGFQFSWAPDGKQIAFAENDGGTIFTVQADGTDKKRLVGGSGTYYAPVWSPDGQRIAFYSTEGGHWALHVVQADGKGNVDLSGNTVFGGIASWSPDGTMIAYEAQLNTMQEADIYVVGLDGSDPVQLTFGSAADIEPAWSPDGQWIAFTSLRDDKAEIYVMRPDGSEQHRLTDSPGDNAAPVWSPDGKRIAFISWRDEAQRETCESHCNIEIYGMDADGGNLVRLTDDPAPDYHPAWSPDGKYLAFASQRAELHLESCGEHCNSEIYLLPVPQGAGAPVGEVVRLTDDPAADWAPQWQPSLTRELAIPTPKPTLTPLPTPMAQQVVDNIQQAPPGPERLNPSGPWLMHTVPGMGEDTSDEQSFLTNLDGSGGIMTCAESRPHKPHPLAYYYPWLNLQSYSLQSDYFVCLEPVDPATHQKGDDNFLLVVRRLPGGQKVDGLPLYSTDLLQALHQLDPDEDSTAYVQSDVFTTLKAVGQILWSPDGRYLAYTSAADGPSTDVYVYDTVSQVKRRLTDGPTQATLLAWSPDSQWIIHTAWVSGERTNMNMSLIPKVQSLWAVSPQGGEVKLLHTLAWESEEEKIVAWLSPASFVAGSVMYAHDFGTELSHLRIVDINKAVATMLYEPAVESAAYDPATQTLMFTSGVFTGDGDGVFWWRSGLPAPRQVDARLWHEVRWLPEIEMFVAEWFWEDDERMILITPDGQISHLFANEEQFAPLPSPDGQWVAFVGKNAFGQQGIRLYDRQGNWVKHILPEEYYRGEYGDESRSFAWKPDSSGFWMALMGRIYEYTLTDDFITQFEDLYNEIYGAFFFSGFVLRP